MGETAQAAREWPLYGTHVRMHSDDKLELVTALRISGVRDLGDGTLELQFYDQGFPPESGGFPPERIAKDAGRSPAPDDYAVRSADGSLSVVAHAAFAARYKPMGRSGRRSGGTAPPPGSHAQ